MVQGRWAQLSSAKTYTDEAMADGAAGQLPSLGQAKLDAAARLLSAALTGLTL